eukprot:TRINITY_DN76748_c0_g1_i1.p2 TRINITY_DN76748_c0_g1~~TRINITY_DN76748_c0_g1_i1.p2  ORF type:complete len:114 (-),score=20.65 TRINITY_DN76748_c0_g1_i1:16-357(-)
MSVSPFAGSANPSKLGDIIEVSGAQFIRIDNPLRLEMYTKAGAKLVVMHDVKGHGGYFTVPDGNLMCGLLQWVVESDMVVAHYWMEKREYDGYAAQEAMLGSTDCGVGVRDGS